MKKPTADELDRYIVYHLEVLVSGCRNESSTMMSLDKHDAVHSLKWVENHVTRILKNNPMSRARLANEQETRQIARRLADDVCDSID